MSPSGELAQSLVTGFGCGACQHAMACTWCGLNLPSGASVLSQIYARRRQLALSQVLTTNDCYTILQTKSPLACPYAHTRQVAQQGHVVQHIALGKYDSVFGSCHELEGVHLSSRNDRIVKLADGVPQCELRHSVMAVSELRSRKCEWLE